MQVIGMGETKTPTAFISACNQFKYLDKLFEDKQTTEEPAADNEVEKINNTIKSIIENFSDDDGWIFSGRLGDQLSKRLPDFDVRNYGYSKLTLFMKSLGEYEINKISLGNHQKQIYFRIKQEEKVQEEPPKKKYRRSSGKGSRRSGGRR